MTKLKNMRTDMPREILPSILKQFLYHEGAIMGNPLSPFIAGLFMNTFEQNLRDC